MACEEVPDEVVVDVVNYIREANVDGLQAFLHGPFWHLNINWHIDLSPSSNERQRLQDVVGRSLLSAAAFCSSAEVIKLMLHEHADVDVKDIQTDYTPLMVAIKQNRYEIVKLLLEHDASKALLDSDGHHALHVAAMFAKDVRIMQLLTCSQTVLLDAPAGEGPDKGTTALDLVLTRRILNWSTKDHSIANQIVRCLLHAGAKFRRSELLIIQPWLKSFTQPRFHDDDLALLLEFVEAGLDLELLVDDFPMNPHLNAVTIGHALVFHASEPGFGSVLSAMVEISQPEDKKHFLHTLCSGCYYNYDSRVEDDVSEAITILMKRGIDPDTADSTCYTPLNCFLDSVAWYDGERPQRLGSLRVLLESGANPCSGDGNSYSVRQVLEGPDYAMKEGDNDFDYRFDVICLLMQYFPNDMRGAPQWQRKALHRYLPITPRFTEYNENGFFDAALKQHSGLLTSSVTIFRRAAQAVSIKIFLDSETALRPPERDHNGILEALTLQRAQSLPGVPIPRDFVIDVLSLLGSQERGMARQSPDKTTPDAFRTTFSQQYTKI